MSEERAASRAGELEATRDSGHRHNHRRRRGSIVPIGSATKRASPNGELMMGRTSVALLLAALLLAGCGGSEAEPVAGGDTDSDTSDSTAGDSSDPGATGPANYAVVRVGDVEYDFPADPLNTCNNLGSVIGGSFATGADGAPVQAGGPDVVVQINFVVPIADWEAQDLQPPNISVDDLDEGVRWQSGGFDDIEGQFESWEMSAGLAEGTASFIDWNADRGGEETESIPGSFEILCNQ
jgi:hypothetical protein